MEYQTLSSEYSKIERRLFPIMEYLDFNKSNETIKSLYKGFITIQSSLVYNPDILFIGINPGQGAFKENEKRKIEELPIRLFDSNNQTLLDWYKDGNARGHCINKQWYAYKWYEREKEKKINNRFVANMIDLLYKVAEIKCPDYINNNVANIKPAWYNDFGQNIMFTNLYPIATKNASDLKPIFKLLSADSSIKPLFGSSKKIKRWDVQRFFIRCIEDLVVLVNPKTIVCLGVQAFNDFTFTTTKKTEKVFKGKKGQYSVIGFDRSGNWNNLTHLIAKEIASELQ